LRLKGVIYSEEKEEMFHLEDIMASRFLYGRLDASQLLPSPEDSRWIESLPTGILQEAAGRLCHMTLSRGPEAEIASRALLALYAIAGEGVR